MPCPTLPTELWRPILRLATYTPTCFDTSPYPDTWNPVADDTIEQYDANFRTKRALAFVSRQIRHISLEFLCDILVIQTWDYDPAEGIVCMNIGRITPLIPYLPTTQHLLVDIRGSDYFGDVARSLEQILRQCHNLYGLHISFPEVGGRELENDQSLQRIYAQMQIARAVCPGLQFLDIRGYIREEVYRTLLNRVSLTLRAHSVSAFARNFEEFDDGVIDRHPEDILLPQLDSLYVSIYGGTEFSLSKYNMSALTYLVIGTRRPHNTLTQILESARHSILTLRLEWHCAVDNDVLSIALRAPRLQVLAYPYRGYMAWLNDEQHHDTLREILVTYDIFLSPLGTPEGIAHKHFNPISKFRFPMLTTFIITPLVGPQDIRGLYDLEDGKRLEDDDTITTRKLYLRGMPI